MSPRERRRRSRRRPVGPTVVTLVALAVALFLLIGGVAHIGSASVDYRRSADRSFAAQGSMLVAQSNRSASQLSSVMNGLPSPATQRMNLEARLDELVDDTAAVATQGRQLAAASSVGAAPGELAGVLEDRAQAVAQFRAAIDGLLGMAPLPVAGTSGAIAPPSTPTLIPADRVSTTLVGVGDLLAASDRSYAHLRAELRRSAGTPRLPASAWVTGLQMWAPGPIATLVGQVAASPSLAVHHQLVLVPNGVRIAPSALPAPGGVPGPGPATLPPTGTVAVSAVVADDGNVPETGVVLTASLQPQGAGIPATVRTTLTLQPGTSMVAAVPTMHVLPGATYILTVAVTPPPAQVDRTGLTQTYPITIAPTSSGL
jgi:hypothetical protein